jgi:hypothetical protein
MKELWLSGNLLLGWQTLFIEPELCTITNRGRGNLLSG